LRKRGSGWERLGERVKARLARDWAKDPGVEPVRGKEKAVEDGR